MAALIAIPVLGVLAMLQTGVVSRLSLLHGMADIILLAIIAWALQKRVQTAWQWCIIGALAVNFVSAIPLGVPLVGYSLTTAIALGLRRRVWQVPILAMYLVSLVGTLIMHALSLAALRLAGSPIPVLESLNLVTLPSILLNLLFALPLYALAGELAGRLYPEEIEV